MDLMKSVFNSLGFLALLLVISACGKDPKDAKEQAAKPIYQMTPEELTFNAARDLLKAIASNDLLTIKKIMLENPQFDLNQLTDEGETLLTHAIKNDFTEIRDFLLDQKVDINKANVNGQTPLMVAVLSNHMHSMSLLLDLKANTRITDPQGDNVLHMAIKNKNDEMTLVLLRSNVNPKAKDRSGRDAAKLAFDYKAGPEVLAKFEIALPDMEGYIKILDAADLANFELIVAKQPKIVSEYERLNPLVILAESPNVRDSLTIAHRILSMGIKPDGPVAADAFPLISAVVHGKRSFVRLLLTSGANVNVQDQEGKSALIHAVYQNRFDLVNMLVNRMAVIRYKTKVGNRKVEFNACEISEQVKAEPIRADDILTAETIQLKLGCRFRRSVDPENRDEE